jgi:hypothetical protein
MDIDYFVDQIHDELDGSIDYIKLAIEIRPMNLSWSKTLVDMSAAEMNHAVNLFHMLEEYYTKIASDYVQTPDWLEDGYKEIADEYVSKIANIKHMHEVYNM